MSFASWFLVSKREASFSAHYLYQKPSGASAGILTKRKDASGGRARVFSDTPQSADFSDSWFLTTCCAICLNKARTSLVFRCLCSLSSESRQFSASRVPSNEVRFCLT